jgi:hypothetical protein
MCFDVVLRGRFPRQFRVFVADATTGNRAALVSSVSTGLHYARADATAANDPRFFAVAEAADIFSDIATLLSQAGSCVFVACLFDAGLSILGYRGGGSLGRAGDGGGSQMLVGLGFATRVSCSSLFVVAVFRFVQAVSSRAALFAYLRSGEGPPSMDAFGRIGTTHYLFDVVLALGAAALLVLTAHVGRNAFRKRASLTVSLR